MKKIMFKLKFNFEMKLIFSCIYDVVLIKKKSGPLCILIESGRNFITTTMVNQWWLWQTTIITVIFIEYVIINNWINNNNDARSFFI